MIDAGLARALLESQYPHLPAHRIERVGEGWDNVTYRVGSWLALRLPRHEAAADQILNEQRWLPLIAPWLSLDVPRLVAAGRPSDAYRWPWSVVEWVPGALLGAHSLRNQDAARLAENLQSLHRPAPSEAPLNPFRGVPLASRREVVEDRLARFGLDELSGSWRRAVQTPWDGPAVWLHGDLHPRNVVVRDGVLSGLIDWGDITAGDPSTDLACAWTLLDSPSREVFRAAYAPSEEEWTRAFGWAVNLGTALLDSGEPEHEALGRMVVCRLLEDVEAGGV